MNKSLRILNLVLLLCITVLVLVSYVGIELPSGGSRIIKYTIDGLGIITLAIDSVYLFRKKPLGKRGAVTLAVSVALFALIVLASVLKFIFSLKAAAMFAVWDILSLMFLTYFSFSANTPDKK